LLRQADNFVDFQAQATEFAVGDVVVPFGFFESQAGRVTAVWPAIGMVDVKMPTGTKRWPVEDLQRFVDGNAVPPSVDVGTSIGDLPTVSVPGGPDANRVASAFAKKALYWATKGRQYRMTRSESESGRPCCPRCAEHPELKRAIYKRRDGASTKLLGCQNCLFLIKDTDITNHPSSLAMVETPVEVL
tara:strand:- start:434 stop:997 length:564 start_codon:yes stop_codon:yes gene_type:complete